MKNRKIYLIVNTAIMTALLVVMQAVTANFGQFVTGSIVNLILIVTVITVDFMLIVLRPVIILIRRPPVIIINSDHSFR